MTAFPLEGVGVYRNREEAGDVLAQHLTDYRGRSCVVIAIPNGGVPVGLRVRTHLGADFGILVVRKLHIPWDREAGFGAVAPDGTVVFNELLRRSLDLSEEEERSVIEEELTAIQRRMTAYRAQELPRVEGRVAILVDDGLASGYSMIAAARFVRRRKPAEVVVAVPTASRSASRLVSPDVDTVVCPNVRSGPVFAVADAYRHWRDLEDREVVGMLSEYRALRARPRS